MPLSDSNGIFADLESLIHLRMDAKLLKLDLSHGARSILAGQHRSKFRGRGMDYAESRQYQPGDDVRSIDWRLTARTNETYTKVFVEERERPVFLMLDFSPTLYFGTKDSFKSVTAARAAALLSWTAVNNGDRVGGVVVTDGLLCDLKPKAGRKGALSLINALSAATAHKPEMNQPSGFNQALQHLSAVVHPGSLVFMFSDFYSVDALSRKLISKIRQHNDIVACRLIDPIELSPPTAGRYAITNSSKGQDIAVLDTTRKYVRQRYQSIYQARQTHLNKMMDAMKTPVIDLINGESIIQVMQTAFGKSPKSD